MRDNVPCSELPRATLRNRGHQQPTRPTHTHTHTYILSLSLSLSLSPSSPFNRVALFAAQITRESLDGRGPAPLWVTRRRGTAATAPYLGIRRLVRPSVPERVFPSSLRLRFLFFSSLSAA